MDETVSPDPKKPTDDAIREAVAKHGQFLAAAVALGMSPSKLHQRAVALGLKGKWSKGAQKGSLFDTPQAVERAALRQKIYDKFRNRCARCGFKDRRAFQVDHVNDDGAKDQKRPLNDYLRRILADTSGRYQLLCANCNAIKEHDRREGVPWARAGRCRCGKKLRATSNKDVCAKCHVIAVKTMVASLMNNGLTATEAAAELGISKCTAQTAARRQGIQRRRGHQPSLMVSYGAFLHQQGMSVKEAAEVSGGSIVAIYQRFAGRPPR